MLSIERQNLISDMVVKHGMVKVADLTKLFSVSEMTIRRDLDILEKKGVLKKVYGGAVAERSTVEEMQDIPIQVRREDRVAEKRAIAAMAVEFIQPNDVIFLDAGTTTLEIARLIRHRSDLVVITNSLPAATELAGSSVSLLLVGGQVRGTSHSVVGAKANAFLSDLVAGTLFLAASGLSVEQGIMNSNLDESEIKRSMMGHCEKVVLVSDTSKFEHQSFHVFARWSEIDAFITDSGLPAAAREELEGHGIQVLVAE
ncbi:DeoR/GlpR family DNA-binding transcription regulator [Alicyclobacillus tolerans]|uniref:DeoR/GlpR family DNA-binding transcription regulator n=1 Tax=Alicyclobacillus tolerans TaxID=90970 RepID=UPI001F3AB498|nr:DeoR/GlpR family DNA-binding transcription regulator [Alicyclobacillus tolerans]MCF8566706.1 DeoR/GlpR family DNA-binding transcription regulator [Alicyclobacillus tolerans]